MSDQLARSASLLDVNALLEFGRLLNESGDPAMICNNIMLTLMGKLGLGRAAVALPGADGDFAVTYLKGAASALRGLRLRWDGEYRHGLFTVDIVESEPERDRLVRTDIRRIMPVSFGETIFALILLGPTLHGVKYEFEYATYALLIGATAAMALDGCRTRSSLDMANRRLERRVHRLRSLVEASSEFGVLLDRDAILRLLGFTMMGELAVTHFAAMFRIEEGYDVGVNRFAQLPSTGLLDYCIEQGPMLIRQDEEMSVQDAALYDLGVRAYVPLQTQEGVKGVLLVGERFHQSFEEEEVEYISLLANLAMSSLENSRLLGEMIEKQRLEDELKIAAEIQQGLLPTKLPELRGFDIAARTIPSRQVGGDCYDAIDLGNGRVLLSIADVVGKGTPASLLMANMQAALRALARIDLSLTDMVSRINDVIYENTAPDKFITAFFGIVDAELGQISYVNAGHNPPYLFTAGGRAPQTLDRGGLILGIMPGDLVSYETGAVKMSPGDLLLLYTDGVSEALDESRAEYGTDRLCALLDGTDPAAMPAREVVEIIRRDVARFVGAAAQSDDITIVAVRRLQTRAI